MAESLLKGGPPPPPEPEPVPTDPGGGGGGGGGTSGGGDSGGTTSGGGSGPAVDPVVAQKTSAFGSVYSSLWGEPATKAYLEAAAHSGMNVWEFEWRERHKPAFRKTKTYQQEGDALVAWLKSSGVV